MTGNWRDSEQGLGRGRFAYDVNAALVPAALDATARLLDSGLLDEYLDVDQRRTLKSARESAQVWAAQHRASSTSTFPQRRRARASPLTRRRRCGWWARAAQPRNLFRWRFTHCRSTTKASPIPILHSDEGFRLLLTEPAPDET